MTRAELIAILRKHKLAVEATVGEGGAPQAAVVGIAISDRLELVFDTLTTTRKHRNLRADPRVALVVGWDDATAQIEGVADFPDGDELARIRACYFVAYPDGRDRLALPGLTHVRVRPTWVRYSDYAHDPPRIVELDAAALAAFTSHELHLEPTFTQRPWTAGDRTGGPLDEVLDALRGQLPDLRVERLQAKRPADDDNVYTLGTESTRATVQVDTADRGQPPFCVEADGRPQVDCGDVAEAVALIRAALAVDAG